MESGELFDQSDALLYVQCLGGMYAFALDDSGESFAMASGGNVCFTNEDLVLRAIDFYVTSTQKYQI
jgi:hypothetical protein